MRRLALPLLLSACVLSVATSQEVQSTEPTLHGPKSEILSGSSMDAPALSSAHQSPKKPGHYTARDWRALIDSTWGPGPPTSTKLEIFDAFWGDIDREFGGFPHLDVNWDSLRARYRPEIEAGVSRGRFAGIMSRLWISLQEQHTYILDAGIDTVGGRSHHDTYLPGVPVFWSSGWGWAGNFGAALAPLPDSSLLVYRAVNPHPLGLVPGDIVLGYDRIPWKRLYKELLEVELPIDAFLESGWGSTPRSMTHGFLNSAGTNWGLFDTIDVVKYESGDTLHIPTAPLAGQNWRSLFATEQIPVPGVPMPDWASNEHLTWGIVKNTSIGYVYAHSWFDQVEALFAAAMNDLVNVKNVSGLILDCRYNRGGANAAAGGLDYLFNQNPAGSNRWLSALRDDPTDHLRFRYSSPFDAHSFIQADYYDRPIAVLLGPACVSYGDLTAFRLRFHPMVRLFGLPTNGAYVRPGLGRSYSRWETWSYSYSPAQMYSLVNNEGFLMHNSSPVDEEIWLTRDGAAKGEDDVVKRALEWIATLTHAHSLSATPRYARPGVDTVMVTVTLTNPLGHEARVSVALSDTGGAVGDSLSLFNDGLHGDGLPGDSIWGARFLPAPSAERFYAFDLRTDDLTLGSSRVFPALNIFTTAGPVVCVGDTTRGTPVWGQTAQFSFKIANMGSAFTIAGITGTVRAIDTAATILSGGTITVGNLAPGQVRLSSPWASVSFSPWCTGAQSLAFELVFSASRIEYWRDTMLVQVTDPVGIAHDIQLPAAHSLEQNYPNPFNPSTTIRYELPKSSMVRLSVYDILGRELSVLVDERKNAGSYDVKCDAAGLSSGVYVYRIQAGDFVQAKKFVVLK